MADFYVQNYGAVGDGVTDDRAAIQAAINDANASYNQTGQIGNVHLMGTPGDPKAHLLTRNPTKDPVSNAWYYCLHMKTGVNLVGGGIANSQIKLESFQFVQGSGFMVIGNFNGLVNGIYDHHMTYDSFTLFGNRYGQAPQTTSHAIFGIFVGDAYACGASNLLIESVGMNGTIDQYVAGHVAENYGIGFDDMMGQNFPPVLTNIEATDIYGSGITILDHANQPQSIVIAAQLSNCISHYNGGMGYAFSRARSCLVQNCQAFNNGGNGLNDEAGVGNTWSYCNSHHNRGHAARIESGPGYKNGACGRVKYDHCTLDNSGKLPDGTPTGNARDGVRIGNNVTLTDANGKAVYVLDCTITNNSGWGIKCEPTFNCAYLQRQRNTFSGNTLGNVSPECICP